MRHLSQLNSQKAILGVEVTAATEKLENRLVTNIKVGERERETMNDRDSSCNALTRLMFNRAMTRKKKNTIVN